MSRDIGISNQAVFAAFSAALILAALLGPRAGVYIDKYGGRPILLLTNLIFAAGLVGLGCAQEAIGFFAAWLLIGVAMGAGLYEAAFSTAVGLYGRDARNAITGITLFAGLSSTLSWPVSTWLDLEYGWRSACFVWAALHLFVGLPLNASLPKSAAMRLFTKEPAPIGANKTTDSAAKEQASYVQPIRQQADCARPAANNDRLATILLAIVFAIAMFISTAMVTHLPGLLQLSGLTLATAVALSALIGPAQLVVRFMEFSLLRRVHPLLSAQIASVAHPMGAACLIIFGPPAAILLPLLHGAGNGILTIAKGTLPLVIFGPQGYGLRQGLLMVPARIAQAIAPFIFGMLIEKWGTLSLWATGLLGLMSTAALLLLARGMKSITPAAGQEQKA